MSNQRVLLIELDHAFGKLLRTALEEAQYIVESVASIEMAALALRQGTYAAVVRAEPTNAALLESLALQAAREQQWSIQQLEREYITQVVATVQGHRGRAAQLLGIDRRTLYRKLKEYATNI